MALWDPTSKGLCRPPPKAGWGTLLSEQGILAPFQGLLGLIAQLQVGLRHCRGTNVTPLLCQLPYSTLVSF